MLEARADLTRRLVALAAIVVIAYGLHAAASNLVQILLAVFVAVITLPVIDHLRRRRWPMALILVAAGMILAGTTIIAGLLAYDGLKALISRAPEYQDALRQELANVVVWMKGHGFPVDTNAVDDLIAPSAFVSALRTSFGFTTELLRQTFAIVLIVIFIWLESPLLPQRLQPNMDAGNWHRLARNLLDLRRYMALKALMSLLTGVIVVLWCFIMGVPFPFLMGIAAFALNFVPVVGSIVAAVPALAITWVDHGSMQMGVVAIGYTVINIGISNGLEPRVLGRGLGLSPLAVVLSIFVWGWLLGPAGMLLSIPLTMGIRAFLKDAHGCEAWVAFLGDGNPDRQTEIIAKAR